MDTVSEADAEERTTELVQLLPAEWKDADVTAAGLEGLRTRDECKPLLAENLVRVGGRTAGWLDHVRRDALLLARRLLRHHVVGTS